MSMSLDRRSKRQAQRPCEELRQQLLDVRNRYLVIHRTSESVVNRVPSLPRSRIVGLPSQRICWYFGRLPEELTALRRANSSNDAEVAP